MVGRWGCIVAALVAIATAKPNRDCEFDCHGGKCVYEGCEDVTCRGGACEFLECTRPTCDGARAARAAAGFVRGVEADRSQAARASFDGASTRSARAAGPGPASGAPTAPRRDARPRRCQFFDQASTLGPGYCDGGNCVVQGRKWPSKLSNMLSY